jgi:Dimerisation domain
MALPTQSSNASGEPNAGPIFHIATGFMSSKCLFVASELGLFEKLSEGPATLNDLAARISVPRGTTRMVADVMVAHGPLQRDGNRYVNSPLAEAYLGRQPILDLRPFLHYWNRMIYERWMTFEDAVQQGKGVLGILKFSPEEQGIFSRGVEAATAPGANALPDVYDFVRHRGLIDWAVVPVHF